MSLPVNCPACKKKTGCHTDAFGDAPEPQDDDISICLYCCAINEYYDSATKLRALTEDKMAKLDKDFVAKLIKVQTLILQQRKDGKI